MAPAAAKTVILDFTGIGKDIAAKVMANISAVAVAGEHLWTASDEHRSLQCFAFERGRFILKESVDLDRAIKQKLPRAPKEFDLEGLAFDGTYLWFCGSHCRSTVGAPAQPNLPEQLPHPPVPVAGPESSA